MPPTTTSSGSQATHKGYAFYQESESVAKDITLQNRTPATVKTP